MIAEQIDDWTQQLLRQGMAQGVERGRHSGLALTLQRQLTRRFGALPADITARIAAADESQLQNWLDQVLDAPTLAAVFTPA
jgi:flagellar biosynthesis/type III secretory pathway protein FliH